MGKIFGAHLGFSLQVIQSTFFRLIQYKREGMQLHFHISCHIAHLGWETPVFFTLFTLSTYGTVEEKTNDYENFEKGMIYMKI
jgi:hypothetical protein